MQIWRKKKFESARLGKGIAQAAAEGASPQELVEAALSLLAKKCDADRLGAWLEPRPVPGQETKSSPCFRGMVWERGAEVTPPEWRKLTAEFPLAEELFDGESVEQDLDSPARPLLGPLMDMRRVIWVPVARGGHLRGVLLAGTRAKHGALPRALLESVAAELLLALEWEEAHRIARERQADLAMAAEVMAAPNKFSPEESSLALLVKNCTENVGRNGGLGAAFAAIGQRGEAHNKDANSEEMTFSWKSGTFAHTSAVESEPLVSLWKRALKARRAVGCEIPSSWPKGEVERIVALPLEGHGEMLGVLVAGLPPGATSLAVLERLEFRASLAAAALAWENRRSADARREAWQFSLLDSGQAAVVVNARGAIAALSQAARELLKEPRKAGTEIQPRTGKLATREAEPLGASFAQLFCARDQERIAGWMLRTMGSTLKRGKPAEEPSEFELRNTVRVCFRFTVPVGADLYAVLLDPMQAKDMESRPERAEAELTNVLEWLEEGVVLFDAQEKIRAMNGRFTQMVGLLPGETAEIVSLEELIGRLAVQAAEPRRFAERWRVLARELESGVREELQLMRPVPRVLERAARPVLDSAGQRLGRVEIYRDVTAGRLFQSKLLQTEKLAMLGQMVTGVAHELSNPLTSILGFAQRLLLRGEAAGRTEEALKIYEEAERASTILRQLLLNARETRPQRRTVSLHEVVQQATELQRFGLAAEKIRLELELHPDPLFVLGDAGQLQQVLMNLVGNARQAIEESRKGGTIWVRTKRSSDDRVLLEVSDDGPGIPEAIMARIFDPFFTTKPAGVGTGLGLAIVLGIVREHGGQVRVASPPGGGAVFTIELPAASEAIAIPSRHADSGERRAPESRAGRSEELPRAAHERKAGPLVLVVEDEPTVAQLIADVLEDEGMRVEVLTEGRAALNRAAREHFDLVICDMKMPGMDGQNFYKSLARASNSLRERFLFVTGDVVAARTQAFLERYHLPHVAKPFQVEELLERVKQVLDGKNQRETVIATRPPTGTRKKAARNG